MKKLIANRTASLNQNRVYWKEINSDVNGHEKAHTSADQKQGEKNPGSKFSPAAFPRAGSSGCPYDNSSGGRRLLQCVAVRHLANEPTLAAAYYLHCACAACPRGIGRTSKARVVASGSFIRSSFPIVACVSTIISLTFFFCFIVWLKKFWWKFDKKNSFIFKIIIEQKFSRHTHASIKIKEKII